jgi:hypothetical protein
MLVGQAAQILDLGGERVGEVVVTGAPGFPEALVSLVEAAFDRGRELAHLTYSLRGSALAGAMPTRPREPEGARAHGCFAGIPRPLDIRNMDFAVDCVTGVWTWLTVRLSKRWAE